MKKISKFIMLLFVSVIITSMCVGNAAYGDEYKEFSKADVLLNDIAYNGKSTYVAVGSNGEIEVSEDGIHLSCVAAVGIDEDLTKVKWTGKEFIVLGKNGVILTSSDGYEWHEADKTTWVTAKLNNVIWDKNCIVVVGDNGTIYTSKDGRTFKLVKSNTKQSLKDVIRTNSLFLAVGNKGIILASKVGTNWTNVKSGVTKNLVDVSWNGKKYVAVGENAVLTSKDAKKWTAKYFYKDTNLTNIAWSPKEYIVVGTGVDELDDDYFPHLITLKSSDALHWNVDASHDWPQEDPEGLGGDMKQGPIGTYDLIWTGKQFILVCYSDYLVRNDGPLFGHNSSIEFYDGEAWNPIAPSHEGYLEIMRKAMWDGKNLIVVGDTIIKYLNNNFTSYARKGESSVNGTPLTGYNGKEYIDYSYNLTSKDGEYWYHDEKIRSDCELVHYQNILWNGKIEIAISAGVKSHKIVYSYDGFHWKDSNLCGFLMKSGIEDKNGKYIFKTYEGNTYVSTDGIRWSKQQ